MAHDPAWAATFEAEACRIRAVFGALAASVEHVGSTAVAGLAAKPVIDIQLSVASLEPLEPHAKRLASLGYVHVPVGDFDRIYPFFQRPAQWPCTHHVHLCVAGGSHLRTVSHETGARAGERSRRQCGLCS